MTPVFSGLMLCAVPPLLFLSFWVSMRFSHARLSVTPSMR